MKKYLIKSEHEVFKLNENNYEGEIINYYEMSAEVRGNNVEEAIKKYIENILYFTYNNEYIQIGLNDINEIQFLNTVDTYNCEDEDGEFVSSNILYVYELKKVDLTQE